MYGRIYGHKVVGTDRGTGKKSLKYILYHFFNRLSDGQTDITGAQKSFFHKKVDT